MTANIRDSRTIFLGSCLAVVLLGAALTGCTTTGLYGRNGRHLDTATRAFFSKDWAGARKGFAALAGQTDTPDAAAAGRYGLICLDMAAARDIPSFLDALETLSRFQDAQRFRKQDPALLLGGVNNGIRLMAETQREQQIRIRDLRDEKDRALNRHGALEQAVKDLKYQLREIERIDRELQEKRK